RRERGELAAGERAQAVGEDGGALLADPLQDGVARRCDGQRAGSCVPRHRAAVHVAAFFERGDQPGQSGWRDPLGGGEIPETRRAAARLPPSTARGGPSASWARRAGRVGQNGCMEDNLAGRLLVATPLLGDANFRRSVVLVVEDEPEEGTLGVVLNRPTETPVGQVLESWTGLVTGPSVVFRGGPVSPNSALGLAIVPGEDEPVGWRALDGMTLRSRIGLVDLDAPPQLLEGGIASLR